MDDVALPGLSANVLGHDGTISLGAWLNAVSVKAFVGICKVCLAPLKGEHPEEQRNPNITWFTARCTSCGHEVTSPSGRKLARTMRSWERR